MAPKEKELTPAIVSFASLVGFMNELREHGEVPTRIDKSLMMKSSGSQVSAMIASLRFLDLIDEGKRPVKAFHDLVLCTDEERKPGWKWLLETRYPFLFNDTNFSLSSATADEMAEKFRALGISGSTVTKTVAFFLAAAKEAGIKVSPHVRPPPPPRGSNGPKKVAGRKDSAAADTPPAATSPVDDAVERFEIPIPGKASAKVFVPKDFDAEDWEMFEEMLSAYIRRWKKFDKT